MYPSEEEEAEGLLRMLNCIMFDADANLVYVRTRNAYMDVFVMRIRDGDAMNDCAPVCRACLIYVHLKWVLKGNLGKYIDGNGRIHL